MEINELFNKKPLEENNNNATGDRQIVISKALEFLPLTYGIEKNLIPHSFKLSYADISDTAEQLRQGAIELGIISTVEYARRKETWNLIPGLCVSTKGSLKTLQLFFKKGLKSINKIAVDQNAGSNKTLLQILLREKYLLNPEYVEMAPDLDLMLEKADAAFLVGEPAIKNFKSNRNRLDLGEEWYDLTGLPYTLAFWAGRQFTINEDDVNSIKKSFEIGSRNLEKISKDYAKSHPENWAFYHDILSHDLSYQFSEDAKDGLMEFYNFAFYFGYIDQIPDLHFY